MPSSDVAFSNHDNCDCGTTFWPGTTQLRNRRVLCSAWVHEVRGGTTVGMDPESESKKFGALPIHNSQVSNEVEREVT